MEKDTSNKIFENVIIICLISVFLCLLFPVIQKIIKDSQVSGAETSAKEIVTNVEVFYSNISILHGTTLPFTITYNEDGYVAYEGNKPLSLNEELTNKGETPTQGTVTIGANGYATVKDLKIGNYICNKTEKDEVKCEKSS